MVQKIWLRLVRTRVTDLKLQRSMISTVVGFITAHCTIGMHTRRIRLLRLANNFCRTCGGKEDDENVHSGHLVGGERTVVQ